jgi:hypothetical protein
MKKLNYNEFRKEIKTNKELQQHVREKTAKVFDSQTTARTVYAKWFAYKY